MILVIYDLIMSPIVAFSLPQYRFLDVSILIFWTIDILATCTTAIYVDGTLVRDRSIILRRYLRTWFTFDVLILIPEYVSVTFNHNSLKSATTLRVFRLVRLFRMFKLQNLFRMAEDRLNSNVAVLVLGIVRFAVFFLLMNHFLACIWYAVGNSSPTGWVSKYIEEDSGPGSRYLVALHWAASQFSSSTEVIPGNSNERLVAALSVLTAVILESTFVGIVTNMLLQLVLLQKGKVRYKRSLRSFIKHYGISRPLSQRIRKYLDACYDGEQSSEYQRKLLLQLPTHMLTDVHEEARAPIMRKHPYFFSLQSLWPQTMRTMCHEAITQFNVAPGDVIFSTGDACSRMLFIDTGSLSYWHGVTRAENRRSSKRSSNRSSVSVSSSTNEPVLLKKHRSVSEAALWVNWSNAGQLSALSEASLLAVHVDDFTRTLDLYESPFNHACRYAQRFFAVIILPDSSDLTRGDSFRY